MSEYILAAVDEKMGRINKEAKKTIARSFCPESFLLPQFLIFFRPQSNL